MGIRPIRTEEDHQQALSEVERLWEAPAGSPEADRLEVLATLIDAYEEKAVPILPPDPIDAILFRMEQMALSRRDLEPLIGGRGRVSEVLNRDRPLTLRMIQRLHKALDIPAELLIASPAKRERFSA